MSFSQAAVDFLVDPSPTNLNHLRSLVRDADNYRWDAQPAGHVGALLTADDASQAVAALESLLPGAFLNPGVHLVLTDANRLLGDTAAAERENTLFRATTSAILNTGDGTEAKPWSVLMLADEYDVLSILGKTSEQQFLIEVAGVRLDKHQCTDGSEAWFAPEWLG
jgi:hypothetical protein